MKKFLFFFMLTVLFNAPQSAAQELRQDNQILTADVGLSDASLSQEGRSMTVSFTLTNHKGIQTGVKYAVILASGEGEDAYIADEFVYNEILLLRENEAVERSVIYTPPLSLSGTYTLYVLSKNETGFPFGMIPAGTVVLTESSEKLMLDTSSCYLTIQGNAESPRYMAPQLVTIAPTEQLQSHCVLHNQGDSPREVTPIFLTHAGSTFGPVTDTGGSPPESVSLKAKEKREIVTMLPRGATPDRYAVTLSYSQNSNAVTYQYTVEGNFGTILNAYLDKTTYESGDTARSIVSWNTEGVASSTLTLRAAVRDAFGDLCGEHTINVATGGSPIAVLDVPLSRACPEPMMELMLTDATLGVLDTASFGEHAGKSLPKTDSPTLVLDAESESVPSLWISFTGLLLALALLVYSISRRDGKTSRANLLTLLFVIIVAGMFGIPDAQAASFTQGGCSVSLSLDPVSPPIRTGDTISVYGYTSCPGLQVDATLLSAGYGFSVTANAFGGISGSFPAPPTDDNIQYISGDWTTSSMCSGCTTPPFDFIFVNRCIPSIIKYCSTPDAAFLGVPVGVTGGTCASAGTCSYTCKSDLTWGENSNSCGAPPPPPPGSTPQFTSPLSCVIQANASTCMGVVGINVPTGYTFGADLKTCGGTFIQTLPPGNHSVSVPIPYNTACFNLHPWSFLSPPPTDTINGSSSCAPGTTWSAGSCVTVVSSTYTLTVASPSNGSISGSGINCPGTTCTLEITQGSVVTLNALPDPTFSFNGWGGGTCTGNGACSFPMTGPVTVTGSFTPTAPLTPDLVSQNQTLSSGPYTQGTSINLSAQVRNNGTAPAGAFSDEFSFQWNGTGGSWTPIATIPHNGGLVNAAPALTDNASYNPTQAGTLYIQHCVDSTWSISEGAGENPNCWVSGGLIVGTAVVTNPDCPTTLLAGNCSITQTSYTNTTSGTCTNGTSGTCSYTCGTSGSWDVGGGSNACVTPPTGDLTVNPTTITAGQTVNLTWTSSNGGSVQVTTIPNTGSWSGSSGTNVSSNSLTADTNFILASDGTPLDSVNVTVLSQPTLTASPTIVRVGSTVILTWNTHNGDETQCTLSGGSIVGNPLLSGGGGNAETGSTAPITITGRTTFTLFCPLTGGTAVRTVEAIPSGGET